MLFVFVHVFAGKTLLPPSCATSRRTRRKPDLPENSDDEHKTDIEPHR
jgi:hypothetical protein